MSKKLTKEEIIGRFKKVHKGKDYDYSLFLDKNFEYKDTKQIIGIICPKHGVFKQSIGHHFRGEGCQKCAQETRIKKLTKSYESFLEEAVKIHGNKFIYLKDTFKNRNTEMYMICTLCGTTFKQKPSKHLIGEGCMNCYKSGPPNNKMSVQEFEERATKIHNGKYKYIGDFTETKKIVTAICPIHGKFTQEAQSHLQGHGCPKCANIDSKGEREIYEYVCKLVGEENVIRQDRSVLKKRELDIYIPKYQTAIEFNGIRWHSEEFNRDNKYHLKKLEECNENGVKLIQIFEDEWIEKKDIVLKKIEHILGFDNGERIYARNCTIKECEKQEAYKFLEKNHIQGSVGSTVFLGAYDKENTLIGVMAFKKENDDKWNLTRFATDINKRCIGLASKLFKTFLRVYNPSEVKSFADRRWTLSETNNVYVRMGFELEGKLKPDYRYVNEKRREHKFGYRKEKLHKKYNLPLSMTETEMTKQLGFYRIWDCGLFKYVWKKTS